MCYSTRPHTNVSIRGAVSAKIFSGGVVMVSRLPSMR
jgi:hypothetical protein